MSIVACRNGSISLQVSSVDECGNFKEWLVLYIGMASCMYVYSMQEWLLMYVCRNGSLYMVIIVSMQEWLLFYVYSSMQEWLVMYVIIFYGIPAKRKSKKE